MGVKLELRLDPVVDVSDPVGNELGEKAVQALTRPEALWSDRDIARFQAGEVQELLDQLGDPSGLIEKSHLKLPELFAAQVERGRDSVNDRDRCAQLVRGDRDEVALGLVQPRRPWPERRR
jgi:hypothetical protein